MGSELWMVALQVCVQLKFTPLPLSSVVGFVRSFFLSFLSLSLSSTFASTSTSTSTFAFAVAGVSFCIDGQPHASRDWRATAARLPGMLPTLLLIGGHFRA